jgi:hypothetical protein
MILNCTINQPEAIRRGYDAIKIVPLEVDLSTMCPECRDILASRFKDGHYKEGFAEHPATLNEPTLAGLMENIREVLEYAAKKKTDLEQQDRQDTADAREQFAARLFESRKILVTVASNGTVGFTPMRYDTTSINYIEKLSQCNLRSDAYAKEWKRLLATPEGVAWTAELDSDNAGAREIAVKEALANHLMAAERTAKADAEKLARLQSAKADVESLRQWSLANGSETLRLRTEEKLDWLGLAREEWAEDAIRRAGIDNPVPDMDGYEHEEIPVTKPTAQEIKALRRIREAMANIPEAKATVELMAFRYTEENDNFHIPEPKVVTRKEIAVTIQGMHCDTCHFFFAR